MDEIVTPEAQIETLLQILAAILDKQGGEIVLSRKDFEMYEGAPVVVRRLSGDYVLIRIAYEDEVAETDELDIPETPQT
jgi:hypothetical protein